MPRGNKPRDGSLAYWPRKRSARSYPRLTRFGKEDKSKLLAFTGYKAGMLHAIVVDNNKGSETFGQEISVPITVLECPPLVVLGIRAYVSTPKGLSVLTEAWASKLPKGFDKDLAKKIKVKKANSNAKLAQIEKSIDKVIALRMIVATQPRLAGVEKKKPEVFEIALGGKTGKEMFDFAKPLIGAEVKASDVLREGELTDVVAITTGKGTQGPVKRFGVKIQGPRAAGKRRHVGSLGQERPGKVRHTVAMAGQMGYQRRTEINKRILKIGSGRDINPKSGFNRYGVVKSDYIIMEGSVPGPKKRLVFVRSSIRPAKAKVAPKEIKEIVK